MVVIIAEKPSLARNIAAGIGEMKRRDGYLEGQGYIITWAFGHLFSLCDIEAYTGVPEGGKLDNGKTRTFTAQPDLHSVNNFFRLPRRQRNLIGRLRLSRSTLGIIQEQLFATLICQCPLPLDTPKVGIGL